MKWFREGASPYHTALAMVGAKAGQRVVIIGPGSGPVAAELARVAGLNGRVLVVDRDPAAEAAVEAAAVKAGALVEFERAPSSMLPLDAEAFDIFVLHGELSARSQEDGRLAVAEARRVLRPGGALAIYTPNRDHWAERLKARVPGLQQEDHIAVRPASRVVELVARAGFVLEELFFTASPYPVLGALDRAFLSRRVCRFRTCLRARKPA